jgi:hypothetical protein
MGVMRGKPESRKYCKAQIWLTFDSFQSTRDCLGETRELWPSLKPFINISNLSEETATPENNTERPPRNSFVGPVCTHPYSSRSAGTQRHLVARSISAKTFNPLAPLLKGSRHDDN